MSLIRKQTLYQLMRIYKQIMDEVGDIGEETTKDYENHYDTKNDTDIDFDSRQKLSDEIQKIGKNFTDWKYLVRFGQRNLGECIGDLTNQKYANHYWTQNPFNQEVHKELDTYEDFGLMSWFNGNYWGLRKPNEVQKFDYPDEELFKSDKEIISKTENKTKTKNKKRSKMKNENFIYRFDEFTNEDSKWIPNEDEISIIMNYLRENYPIREEESNVFNKPIKFIIIDEKPYYLSIIPNKNIIRKKLFNEIKYVFDSFKDSSINKAIKTYINESM